MAKTMRKTNLKIQMLAGKNLNSCPDSDSDETLTLVVSPWKVQKRRPLSPSTNQLFQHIFSWYESNRCAKKT